MIDLFNPEDMIENGKTIADDIDIDALVPQLAGFRFYIREPVDCPYARGNWIIEFERLGGQISMLRYNKDIELHRIREFLKPLVDAFKSYHYPKEENTDK